MTHRFGPAIRSGAYAQSGVLEVGNPSRAMRMQAGFYLEGDPRQRSGGIYTVQFNVRGLHNPAATPTVRNFVNPTALVVFSVEGNSVYRRVSVANGTSISGVADHVEVRVVDESISVVGVLEYEVAVTVAPYPRPTGGTPPYLRGPVAQVLAPGAALDVNVPADSGVTSLIVPASGGIPTVTQLTPDLTPLGSYDPTGLGYVPIIPECGVIRLGNDAGAPSNATFSLLWGIDG